MKKASVIAMIIAFAFIFIGIGMLVYSFATVDFNFKNLFNRVNEIREIKLENDFASLDVDDDLLDIQILPSKDGVSKVEYSYVERIDINTEVLDNTLKLSVKDNREWHDHIGIFWHDDLHITIYLAENDYKKLSVKSKSADISVSENLSFENVNITSNSGDISLKAKAQKEIFLKTTSGDIDIKNVSADIIKTETTSGDVKFVAVNATASLSAEAVSGDIEFSSIDAPALSFKTTSGDIEGTLLTNKHFVTETVSGDINVPKSGSFNELCEAKTTSGDIEIKIK